MSEAVTPPGPVERGIGAVFAYMAAVLAGLYVVSVATAVASGMSLALREVLLIPLYLFIWVSIILALPSIVAVFVLRALNSTSIVGFGLAGVFVVFTGIFGFRILVTGGTEGIAIQGDTWWVLGLIAVAGFIGGVVYRAVGNWFGTKAKGM